MPDATTRRRSPQAGEGNAPRGFGRRIRHHFRRDAPRAIAHAFIAAIVTMIEQSPKLLALLAVIFVAYLLDLNIIAEIAALYGTGWLGRLLLGK